MASIILTAAVLAANNGRALLPPMGWRSWNCFYHDISDARIRSQIDAVVKPRDSDGTSLQSLGFNSIGIDEGWEGCKMGINGTVHYKNGTPAVNPTLFPSMPALVAYAKSKKVKMGFYLNGCGCNEKRELRINYEGDVRASVEWGFDSVKIDSCGAQTNSTLYYELFNQSGKAMAIEQCHQGQNITDGGNPGQMGPGWCPYTSFRTSGDIVNLWDRVMSNLMTTAKFLEPDATATGSASPTDPVSRPGCWAYPDMLEVGRMPEHNAAESRSHFSAWAMVSAPLILGFDLSNETKLAAAWPVISNKEVLEISQSWVVGAKYPSGRLVKSWQAPNVPTLTVRGSCAKDDCADDEPRCAEWATEAQCALNPTYMLRHCKRSCGACDDGNFSSWAFRDGRLSAAGVCVDLDGQLPEGHSGSNVMHALPCDHGKASQKWQFNGTGGAIQATVGGAGGDACLRAFDIWLWSYPIVDSAPCDAAAPPVEQQWTLHPNGTLSNAKHGCIAVSRGAGPPSTIWVKPLAGKVPGGPPRYAVLAINGADMAQPFKLNFAEILHDNLPALEAAAAVDEAADPRKWSVRDLWSRADLGQMSELSRLVPPHDCILLVLSPLESSKTA